MDNDFIKGTDSTTVFTFAECDAMQKPYADKFAEWLRARPGVGEVKKADIEDDLRGIDFFVTNEKGNTYTVQLKVDKRADGTGNLPCETVSQAYSWRNSVIGAEFNMSCVDYIFFLLVPSGRILGYTFREFLEYVIEHYANFRNFSAKNEHNGVQYTTLGCLIPIGKINHLIKCKSKIIEVDIDLGEF